LLGILPYDVEQMDWYADLMLKVASFLRALCPFICWIHLRDLAMAESLLLTRVILLATIQ
jgi:hypothetical protein